MSELEARWEGGGDDNSLLPSTDSNYTFSYTHKPTTAKEAIKRFYPRNLPLVPQKLISAVCQLGLAAQIGLENMALQFTCWSTTFNLSTLDSTQRGSILKIKMSVLLEGQDGRQAA